MAHPEGRMREIVELLSKFSVEKLSNDWVTHVIDSDFTEVDDLPPDYEDEHVSTNFSGLFSAVIGSCRQWIDSLPNNAEDLAENRVSLNISSISEADRAERDTHTRFWIELAENVKVKSLMALLFYYIHRGQRYDAREQDREFGIQGADLYFLMLCIPGSNAFRIFHPVMYLKALDVLRLTTKLNVALSSPSKKGRGAGGRGSAGSQRAKSHDVPVEDDEEESEMAMLSPHETSRLCRSLNVILHDFLRLTTRFSLKHSPESLDETVSILCDVTCCEIHDARSIFLGRHRPDTVTALTYNAYIALQGLCNPIHGKVRKTVIVIFKYIINNILMTCRGSSDLSVRALGVIKDHSLIFVKYILTQITEEAYEGVYILVQQLCIRVTDKSEYRQKTATSVVEILRYLPLPLYSRLIRWFHKFSHNEKASHRMFMLEVISKLLGEEERQAEGTETGTNGHFNDDQTPNGHTTNEATTEGASEANGQEETHENGEAEDGSTNVHDSSFLNVPVDHSVKRAGEKNILSHRFLLSIIFSRARDNAATVRSKALIMLAECTHSSNPSIIQAMREIFLRSRATVFSTPHIPGANINMESPVNEEKDSEIEENHDIEKDLPNAANVMSMLHRRALDDKVTVRKSALQVLENLMRLDKGMINDKNMEVLMDHCRDPALLVRKEMIKALTNMLETYPDMDLTANNWVKGVLPLVLDPEMKVQEMVVTMLDKLLFKRLLPHGCRGSDTPDSKLPWHLLKTVNKNSYHKFFNKTLMLWAKSEHMTPGIIRIARTHIGKENNEGVWTFLAPLSNNMTIKDPEFAVDYFEENCGTGSEVGTFTLNQVLKVLNNSIKHIPGERSVSLQKQLLEPVTKFSVGVELIPAMCDTITLLSYSLHGKEEEGQKAIEEWALPILQACDDHLQAVLFSNSNVPLGDVAEEALFRHLFTMGEIAMLIPHKANKRMFLMLQSIIFHTSSNHSNNLAGAITENYDIPDSQTQRTQPPSTSFIPSPRAQALSVVTLGKMCLQHEDQAKRIIPALGKMLDTTNDSAMKVNIVFTLSDMCVRYATLVDPLLPQVTACLRDPDVIVRRTTLTLVINLLQEDYLKLKGSFYYRILQCLTDEHEDIRDTVVFYVTERLLKRFPKILCQHFIECIFHYNCYEEHESYNRFTQSKQEKELFGLAGPEHKEERLMLYRFMLDHMPDDQRFATTQRLCQDVLGGVVEGKIKLNAASLPMLQDTLSVLSSDEIKLASLKSRPEDQDQPTDSAEQAAMAGQAIKKTIISQVVKRNVIENIVPILIAMKHKLEEARSPLMKHLLLYLKEVLKDYKNEVKEILAGDKQLAKEIDFDLRRFDQEQREEEEKRIAAAAAAAAEANASPRPNSPDDDAPRSPGVPRSPGGATTGSPRTIRAPKTPIVSAKELLKQAVLNSKNVAARRNSLAVNGEEKVENGGENAISKRRASVADFRESNETINGDNQSHVDPRPLDDTTVMESSQAPEREGNESSEIVMKTPKSNRKIRIQGATPLSNGATPSSNASTTPKSKTPTREELLRAISTPHAVINNITFMDNSQELSNISMETSLNQSSEIRNPGDKQPALLLHLMSPEAFANKESDFSKLRRASTRRSLGSMMDKVDENEKESKNTPRSETLNTSANTTTSTVKDGKKNRKSGGLFESLASQADTESEKSSASQEDSETESIASELSDDSKSVSSNKSNKKSSDKERDSRESSPDKPSRKQSKVRSSKGKRSRVMASLSPDPGNTPNTETNTPTNVKPSQKKSKKKSK